MASIPPRHSPYPSRRLRHACENCRRKKSKCPGERPTCSVCARLRQSCVYVHGTRGNDSPERLPHPADHGDLPRLPSESSSTSQRLNAIEARLEQIATGLGTRQDEQVDLARSMNHPQVVQEVFTSDLEPEIVSDGILLYFKNHCNQPCPLLNHRLQDPLSHQYDHIVLNAMLALTLRRSRVDFAHRHPQVLVERSWNLLADAYRSFNFNDAYFQALCLLAQVDFAEGRTERARTQVALGLRLAQAQGMLDQAHYKDGNCRKHQEIVFTLCILDSMFAGREIPNLSIPNGYYRLPPYQGGPAHPEHRSEACITTAPLSSPQNFNIIDSFVQMMHIWGLVTQYIGEGLTEGSHPIWHHKSSRTGILSRLLELEMPMEPHTYAFVGPVNRAIADSTMKPYFRTWMFFQMTHSAMHCCINHPFIIFIKTREHGSRVPLTFLQKAHKDSLIYASWLAKNLTDMETANLDVLDPFLAYLVGIAATIHIEHSSTRDDSIASSARQKIATCMSYISRVSRVWPNVTKRFIALEQLRSRVGNRSTLNYVEDEYDGAVPVRSVRHVSMSSIDESLLWSIFDSSNDAPPNASASVEQVAGSSSEQFRASQPLGRDSSYVAASPMSQSYVGTASLPLDNQHVASLDPLSSEMDLTADWSLLGMPWLAYFPPDANSLDSH